MRLSILPWVVLMRGGGEPQTIERWKQLANGEPDAAQRAAYGYFALTFAELIPELITWQRHLEGLEVRETQLSKTIRAEGEHQGELKRARVFLLEGLHLKFGVTVPDSIRLAIEGTNDMDKIDHWFRALFVANSWDEFEGLMKQG